MGKTEGSSPSRSGKQPRGGKDEINWTCCGVLLLSNLKAEERKKNT